MLFHATMHDKQPGTSIAAKGPYLSTSVVLLIRRQKHPSTNGRKLLDNIVASLASAGTCTEAMIAVVQKRSTQSRSMLCGLVMHKYQQLELCRCTKSVGNCFGPPGLKTLRPVEDRLSITQLQHGVPIHKSPPTFMHRMYCSTGMTP